MQEAARGTDRNDGMSCMFFEQCHCGETRRTTCEAVEHGSKPAAEGGGEEDAQREHERCITRRQCAESNERDNGGKPELCAGHGQRQREEAFEYEEDERERGEERNARDSTEVHIISLR